MADYTAFTIQVTDEGLRDMLIAQLSAAGADGFEEAENTLKAFLQEDSGKSNVIGKTIEDAGLHYSKSVIRERNWNAEWEAGFRPVRIGNFCLIRAHFHNPDKTVMHDIIITPKMSFGTGHHATTCLMIKAMKKLAFNDKTVFDFGTGTGILAILAEKLGAQGITAIDNDEWSINNSAENFKLNNCSKIHLAKENGFAGTGIYNIILANINRNVILENLPTIKQHLSGNGVVLLSGLLVEDVPVVTAAASGNHLKLRQKTTMNGWVCLLMAGA